MLYARGIDGVACFEVIGAVQDDICLPHVWSKALRGGLLAGRMDSDLWVNGQHGRFSGVHFGAASANGGVRNLALQVGQIDRVVINEGDGANARSGKVERGRGSQPPHTDDEHMTVANALLAFDANLVQQDVARVAKQLIVSHIVACHSRASESRQLVFFFLFLASHLHLAGEHGLALQLIQGLAQLKVTL